MRAGLANLAFFQHDDAVGAPMEELHTVTTLNPVHSIASGSDEC